MAETQERTQERRRPYVYELEARTEVVQRIIQVLKRIEPRQRSLDRELANPFKQDSGAYELQREIWDLLSRLNDYARKLYDRYGIPYRPPVALKEIFGDGSEEASASEPAQTQEEPSSGKGSTEAA